MSLFANTFACALPAVLLLCLLLAHPPPVDSRRKWDKMETQVSLFYPGAHYILLTFNDDALSAEDTYGHTDPFHKADANLNAPAAGANSVMQEVLDILHKKKARATFFVQGSNAEKYPEVISRMVRERHEVANLGASACERVRVSVCV
jgi:peptidoglycan/xylan/chitin deacetylase (PgdA/CDA1 family)